MKFKNLSLAYKALDAGGNMPCIINGANEVAVKTFLDNTINFTNIPDVVEYAMTSVSYSDNIDLEVLEQTDTETRVKATEYIDKIKRKR